MEKTGVRMVQEQRERLGSPQLSDGYKTRIVQEIDKDLAPAGSAGQKGRDVNRKW